MERAVASHQLVRRTMALVLAGGRGSRLKQLTDRRAKPAVYFGGKFRIIDFALSNCVNSGIRRIGVVTQYKSHSLLRHLQRGWSFLRAELNEMVDLLPAQQRVDDEPLVPRHRRRGATRTSTSSSAATPPSTSSCWPATTSTRWTTRSCCATTSSTGAGCTVGCIEVPRSEAIGLRRDGRRRRRAASPPSSRSRPIRRRCPASRRPLAGEHGHLRVRRRLPLPRCWSADMRRPRHRATISARTSSRAPWPKAAPWRIRSRKSCVTDAERRAAVLARRRHDRRVLGGQPRPGLDRPRARHLRHALADLDLPAAVAAGQVRPRRQRRATAWRSNTMVSGGCIVSGSHVSQFGAVLQRANTRSFCHIEQAVVLPDVTIGRGCRLRKVVIDRALLAARRPGGRRRSRSSTRAASSAPKRAWC